MDDTLILDRYRPLEVLGEGGFGVVVLAWDTRMQRRVAIKRFDLPLDIHGDPHRPPGLAEARTAAMLNHPGIVTALDFDTDSDEAFIVMEHVDGASLATLLDEVAGPLTSHEVAAIVEGVACALEFAHDNGVLHLDIKPGNVLVTRDGRIKVADFGLAELSTLTGHGAAFGGTPGHMPPEQRTGGELDERTDEWSLAVLAYECLTGENPNLDTTGQVNLPARLDEVLLTAMADNPSERYRSMDEFCSALEPLLGDAVTGRHSLADLVSECVNELEDGTGLERVGLWDRLGGRLGSTFVRLIAAVQAGWLAWMGLAPLGLDQPAHLAGSALVVAAGALAPSLGIGLGVVCMVTGLFAAGLPLAGAGLAVFGAVWWWAVARRSPGAAVLPLAAPMLGALSLPLAQQLIAGFALRPLAAAVSGLLGGVLALLASAATLHGPPYSNVGASLAVRLWDLDLAGNSIEALVTSPATWVALAGWPLAAALMAVGCSRASRLGAFLGTIAGSAALFGAYTLAGRVAIASSSPTASEWTGSNLSLVQAGSLILVLLVVALGAPLRAEEEPVRGRTTMED